MEKARPLKVKMIYLVPDNTIRKLIEMRQEIVKRQLEDRGKEVDLLLKNGTFRSLRKRGGVKC
jgi:hypothetical protein